jgi:hypothetical protein
VLARAAAAHQAKKQRKLGLEEADEDWFVIFQNCRDLTVMSW